MLGRTLGTHCKSGCGLTPRYLKHEDYYYLIINSYYLHERLNSHCSQEAHKGKSLSRENAVRSKIDFALHRGTTTRKGSLSSSFTLFEETFTFILCAI